MTTPAHPEHEPLKATFRIGSVHGRVTYRADQRAFHPSDIPEQARQQKEVVLQSKKKDVLGLSKPEWDASCATVEPLCQRRSRQISKFDRTVYQYNYRCEVLPGKQPDYVPKANKFQVDPLLLVTDPEKRATARQLSTTRRTEELPVHPGLAEKPLWDCATSADTSLRRATAAELEERRRQNSALRTAALSQYKPPVARYKEELARIRDLKRTQRELPGGTVVLEQQQPPPPRHKLALNTVSRKFRVYKHTGVWAQSPVDGQFAWSCCMSEEAGSRGCVVARVVDPDAFNFASP